MAKVIVEKDIKIILKLNIKEASWLRNLMKNPINCGSGATSVPENSFQESVRHDIFHALNQTKVSENF
jgi:hypothetical protein